MTMPRRLAMLMLVFFAALIPVHAQQYATGADVSFLAKCEQDGIVFKEGGEPKDVLAMLREHHYNWVRLRVFHDPSASAEKLPNDLNYTLALAKRAKAMGFHVLLDLHYSDTWTDPGSQFTPAAWSKLKHKQLVVEVFNYTRDTIAAFASAGVMPEMVQVGNEITNGMLWPDGKLPNWANFADLLKAGVNGVEAGRGAQPKPRIMIHIDRAPDYALSIWFFDTLIAHHVPFDIIGLSFYPFSQGDLARMRGNLHDLALRYQHPIIVVETAYHWMPSDFVGKKADFPESPEGQKAFLQAVDAAVRAVPKGLGQGVFYWEPAAEGAIAGRSFFDSKGNVQPVISAFDQLAPH
ncbi:glycoside hydrolase family 53 protein [Granulicella arctica]|uniref:Arabinogalactan endo-beta-1,4-galactanase n=1 Tax=Granulicella arctica TaxID=940613 RepID=A0A7Y9TI87_9BACT|nr:glycosyl hydrolase 53 family protein [Granulicella arctica]NYF81324.1 arabinogalactan endo-1,4-beta-galactosidase [Granulicella arctica]